MKWLDSPNICICYVGILTVCIERKTKGYFVSVRGAKRISYLETPFKDLDEAKAQGIQLVRRLAEQILDEVSNP